MIQRASAQQAAINSIRPAVIIGAGGVGKEVLMRVRRIIVENFGSLSRLPIVQFLHVDTHTDLHSSTPAWCLGEKLSFDPDERVELSEGIRTRIGGDIAQIQNDKRVREWLPDQINLNQDFTTGAGGVRALGRLCFAYSADIFRSKVMKAAEKASNPNSKHATQAALGYQPGNGLDIYFVGSLFGGTGSGSFLDISYNIREQLSTFQPAIYGYLVIGGGQLDAIMKANCYGALKELEYFSSSSIDSLLKPFDIEYPLPGGSLSRLTSKAPPFDVCYLADWKNAGGMIFNKEQLEEQLARNIFFEFTPGIANVKRGKRIDCLATGGRDKLDEKLGRYQGFFSFGLSILEFPALRIRDCLAYGLASVAVKRWLFDQAEDIQNLPGETEAFLRHNGLLEADLLNYLLSAGGEKLETTIQQNLKQQRDKVKALIERSDFDKQAILNEARGGLEHNKALVTFDHDPRKCGSYVASIQERKRTKLREVSHSLRMLVAEMAGNQYEGSRNALKLINDLIARLTKAAEQANVQYKAHQKSAQTALKEVDSRFERFSRDCAPIYREEALFHNTRLHDEAELNFLTKSLKREANRFVQQLLREDVTVSGQIEPSIVTVLEGLRERIELYRTRLEELANHFEQIRRDKQDNLLNAEIVSGVKLSHDRLQAFAKQVNFEQESHRLLGELQNDLGEKDAAGNVIKPKPIFQVISEDYETVRRLIINLSQRRYDGVRNHSIAAELLSAPNLTGIITSQFTQAAVLVQTSGLQDQTLHFPPKNHFRWIGTGGSEEDPAIISILARIPDNYLREGVGLLADKYQLIFAEEIGIFPLRCLPILQGYEGVYKNLTKGKESLPRETDKRIEYRDLFPEPVSLAAIRKNVERAALLGRVFNFLHDAEDPSTGYSAVYLSYYDERSRDMARRKLANDWDTLPAELFSRQRAKEVDRENVFEETPLEILLREIEKRKSKAVTKTDREELWRLLQGYLNGLRDRLEGGDLHPEYIRQREIINEYRQELPPPEGPPPIVATGNDLLATAVVLSPDARNAEGFRKKIRAYLATGASVDDASWERLLRTGIEFWKLSVATATTILEQETAPRQNGSSRGESVEAIARYRELFKMVAEAGRIEPAERERLQEEQEALGLSPATVRAIEFPKTSDFYRRLLADALLYTEIDPATREMLAEHQAILGLSDEDARCIEAEVCKPA